MLFTILLFATFNREIFGLVPKIFNEWLCLGIKEHIDFTKPYSINVGELPLIVWKHDNKYYSTINICKHMGSKLDNAEITPSGCLKCQYHGFENKKDIIKLKIKIIKVIILLIEILKAFNPAKTKKPIAIGCINLNIP